MSDLIDWNGLNKTQTRLNDMIKSAPEGSGLFKLAQQRKASEDEYAKMSAPVRRGSNNGVVNASTFGKDLDWSQLEFDSPLTKQMKAQEKQVEENKAFQIEQSNIAWERSEKARLASQEWQAEQNAVNRNSSKGGGCFITTATLDALGEKDGEIILDEFRAFRDGYLKSKPGGEMLIAKYYDTAPKIIDAIGNLKSVYLLVWAKYLNPCRDLIRAKNNAAALSLYQDMCLTLEAKLL